MKFPLLSPMEEAARPPPWRCAGCAGRGSEGVTEDGWALTPPPGGGQGEGFAPPGIFSPPSLSCAADQGPEAPVLPTLWVPYSGGSAPPPRPLPYLPKAPPGGVRRGSQGFKTGSTSPGARKGKMVLSPVPSVPRWRLTALPGVTHLWAFSPPPASTRPHR